MKPIFLIIIGAWLGACVAPSNSAPANTTSMENKGKMETATFGAGCFWCVEACFLPIEGVHSVVSGYSGGKIDKPTYREICTGQTGHAEVCQVNYDPTKVTYEELLEIFWTCHDPTTLNRQGNDVGTQYRSVIFYHNEAQKVAAEKSKEALTEAKVFDSPIVTEISPLINFFKAEDYHQNYYAQNSEQPYCVWVVKPKVEKVKKVFKEKLKKS